MKIRIERNYIIHFVLILAFLKPGLLNVLPQWMWLDSIFDGLRILSFLLIAYWTLKNKIWNTSIIILAIWNLLLIILTLINSGSISEYINYYFSTLCFCQYINIISNDDKLGLFIKYTSSILFFEIICNFITIIIGCVINGNGVIDYNGIVLNDIYFLGKDNLHVTYYFLFLVCIYIYDLLQNGHIGMRTILGWGITTASVLLCWSATTVLGIFIFMLLVLLTSKFKKCVKLIFNKITALLLICGTFFLLSINYNAGLINSIIVNVFNKNINSLIGRTVFWERTIYYIYQNSFIGYGIENSRVVTNKLLAPHAHNSILQYIYISGILGGVLTIWLILQSINKINNYNKMQVCCTCAIFSFLLLFYTEYYSYNIGFYSLILINNILDREYEGS